MRLLIAVVCSLAFAGSVNAQTVEVRSGQHDGFIRLIVDLPERVDVKIDNWREQANIALPGRKFTFDTSRVFDRISRDQIREVTSGESDATLTIKLGCNCEISSFWHGKSLLVLDVKETDTTLPSIAEVTAPTPDDDAPVVVAKQQREPEESRHLTIRQGTVSLAASLAKTTLNSERDTQADTQQPQQPLKSNEAVTSEPLAREVREHLVTQLGRAATQGLISPRSSIVPPAKEEPKSTTKSEEEPAMEEALPPSGGNINLRAQSSIDRDFLAAIEGGMRGHSAPICVDQEVIAINSWGTDAPFAQQVGSLRKDLVGEFDQQNKDAVIKLAQLYLYFGFGAEARQTLSMATEMPENFDIYTALSSIMEDGHAPSGSALANQLHCDGPSALWAILSYAALPQDTQINSDAALRAFDALPRQLRSHLGPILSRRFLEAGDQKSADNVIRMLNRHQETVTAGANLVEAEIDRAEGENAKAIEGMEEVIGSNTEISAQALIELIDTSLQSETTVSFDHAILAGAYLQQNRDGALQDDLTRVYLMGLAASGAFDQSYEERARLASSLSPGLLQSVDSEMLNQLTQSADEITFLRHVFSSPPLDRSQLDTKVSNDVATRLVGIGFTDPAREFIAQQAGGRLERERKILRARIALLEGRPKQAEADLLDVEGNDADLLRAEARSMSGDHLAAADTYDALGDQQNSVRQAWLAEDWNRLLQAEESTLSSGAALALLNEGGSQNTTNEDQDENADRVLSKNRSLIQQSSSARETIQDVLASNPSPDVE